MKKITTWILIAVIFISIGWFGRVFYTMPKDSNQITQALSIVKPTPLAKYAIENMSDTFNKDLASVTGKIEIGEVLAKTDQFTTYKYFMSFSPDLSGNIKKVAGIINIPEGAGPFPIIVMFRGFVSQENYQTGTGTQPSAKVFAQNGYITIAPDFLGFGESDRETGDIFETRFQTYVTAVTLLKTVEAYTKDVIPVPNKLFSLLTNQSSIFIWGHSNGGQIALTTLEITGDTYPTVLWAPVSMRFPASIRYYVNESDDGGRFLISQTAKFLETYDANKYSFTNYLDKIKAPIQLNQGTSDTSVAYWLTDSLNLKLKESTISAEYIKYYGADHNMRPKWDEVVANNLQFFRKNIK
jgi:dipeptidyl aminopeptidase/acylaminoacyl peptidase